MDWKTTRIGGCNDKYNQIIGELQEELKKHGNIQAKANNILNAWIYTSNKGNYVRGTFCNLFYYWLGDLISKNIDVSTPSLFSQTMQTIYGILGKCNNKQACHIKYKDIDTATFRRMKELFDYKYYYDQTCRTYPRKNNNCPRASVETDYAETHSTGYGSHHGDSVVDGRNDDPSPPYTKPEQAVFSNSFPYFNRTNGFSGDEVTTAGVGDKRAGAADADQGFTFPSIDIFNYALPAAGVASVTFFLYKVQLNSQRA
ncbi:hypothetical protein PCYB_062270 [Plasmodium cynomolgi strain B]|uniref:CYIR protein n=1 Tax=Plasmodium cynomolgi (strain B) TaxID=1120755 RepID=K6UTT0_PLACD|nr:hypothetical protein PCYB_062270 [Plasmodium cynomolgi strain B]GAB65495.1 hypothetical protein PCYB_062270 [Plasmodium cynomolgi strain B]